MTKTLLIVHHENFSPGTTSFYLIDLMRPLWQEAGWRVVDVQGISRRVAADAALLHVDLSVVPEAYCEFVRSYPISINGLVRDIRKTAVSRNRVVPGDGYEGPVIVKTVQNSAGSMERWLEYPWSSLRGFLTRRGWRVWGSGSPRYAFKVWGKSDYRLYDAASEVPQEIHNCGDLIVERFLPEMHEGRYCLREWYFFGKESVNNVELSDEPLFTSGDLAPHLAAPAPPELERFRREMGVEYGKIDYVIRDGRPVVFDVNKTVGIRVPHSDTAKAYAKALAKGLLA